MTHAIPSEWYVHSATGARSEGHAEAAEARPSEKAAFLAEEEALCPPLPEASHPYVVL